MSPTNDKDGNIWLKVDGSNLREWENHVRCKIIKAGGRAYLVSQQLWDAYDLEKDLAMATYVQERVSAPLLMYVELSAADLNLQRVHTNYLFNRVREVFAGRLPTDKLDIRRQMYELTIDSPHTFDAQADQFVKLCERALEAGDQTPELERRIDFLYKLNKQYKPVVDEILEGIRENQPKYDSLGKVIDRVRAVMISEKHMDKIQASRAYGAGSSDAAFNAYGERQCHYCKRIGHLVTECRTKQRDIANGTYRGFQQPMGQYQPSKGNNQRKKRGGDGNKDTGDRKGQQQKRKGGGRDQANAAKDGFLFLATEESDTQGEPLPFIDPFANYDEACDLTVEPDAQAEPLPFEDPFVSHVDQVDQMAACTEPATVTIVTTDHALHANDQAKHPEPTYLIIDSGATSHMTGNLHLLHDVVPCNHAVNLADGHMINVQLKGKLRLQSSVCDKPITFSDTYYVPSLEKTLLSINKITNATSAAKVVFQGDDASIIVLDTPVLHATKNDSKLAVQGPSQGDPASGNRETRRGPAGRDEPDSALACAHRAPPDQVARSHSERHQGRPYQGQGSPSLRRLHPGQDERDQPPQVG